MAEKNLNASYRRKFKKKLGLLANHKSVEIEEDGTEHFIVTYEKRVWRICPERKYWQEMVNGGLTIDIFYGDVASFFNKVILCDPGIPENHGKIWREDEEEKIITNTMNGLCAYDIASMLGRKPSAIINRLGDRLKIDLKEHIHNVSSWNKPLIEILLDKNIKTDPAKIRIVNEFKSLNDKSN